jgi:hypothetical protein
MASYHISIGTPGLLLIQQDCQDLETKNWDARKNMTLTDEHVLVDPMKLHQFGNSVYPKGSHAARLAEADYMVFSSTPNKESSYMFAVLRTHVRVS